MKIKIDAIKATETWRPIIENMNYVGNNLEQIAYYCEHHRVLEKLDANMCKYLLPATMKLLTKINLDNVTFNVTENKTTDHIISVKITKEYTDKLKKESDSKGQIWHPSFVAQMTEQELIEKSIEKINDAIKFLNKNSEVILETNILIKDIYVNKSALCINISYNLKAKQNEPKNEKEKLKF